MLVKQLALHPSSGQRDAASQTLADLEVSSLELVSEKHGSQLSHSSDSSPPGMAKACSLTGYVQHGIALYSF